jgi:hypothetical protein
VWYRVTTIITHATEASAKPWMWRLWVLGTVPKYPETSNPLSAGVLGYVWTIFQYPETYPTYVHLCYPH